LCITVVHAELNAVLNKNTADVKDCTIYVALFPCNECAKVIVQSGISEVVYASEKNANKQEYIASRRLLEMAGVKLTSVVHFNYTLLFAFNALTLVVGGKKGILLIYKTDWWHAAMVICLGRGTDLRIAQLVPLPLTISCSIKSRLV